MNNRNVVYVIACLLLAMSCTEPDYVRKYPTIVSSQIVVSNELVTAEAVIGAMKDRVIDHGFIWSKSQGLANPVTIHLGEPSSDTFSHDLDYRAAEGTLFYARAFLKTSDNMVYGPEMTFEALAGHTAAITNISPTLVEPGVIVTITGHLFGTDASQIAIYFRTQANSYQAEVKTISDTQITVEAPVYLAESAEIMLVNSFDATVVSTIKITQQMPVLNGIISADICSAIEVSGDRLLVVQPKSVRINDQLASPIPVFTATKFVLPKKWHSSSLKITVIYEDYTLTKTFSDPASAVCEN